MTLREVCDSVDVTRRAVQGYEKAGLVLASGKNERGYLIYDADAMGRIKRIKFFQQLGFSIKEIKALIDAPNHVLKSALEEQVEKLKSEKEHMEALICQVYDLINHL